MVSIGRDPCTVVTRSLWARCAAATAVALSATASAANLGQIGPVFEITEQHAIQYMIERLGKMEKSGELARLERETQDRARKAVAEPTPVAGLSETFKTRTYYYDPTVTVPENIVDGTGRVLVPAGFRKNPLEVFSLSKHLLFFDARDERQVGYARRLIDHYKGRVTPILVGGSYLDLMKRWDLRVYYDQRGTLSNRFGIKQVPALVTQEGPLLRIDELRVQG